MKKTDIKKSHATVPLSILYQTCSNSLSSWNLKSIYIRWVHSNLLLLAGPIFGPLFGSKGVCSRCRYIPTVMRDDLGGDTVHFCL
jgi:hypothetical protein